MANTANGTLAIDIVLKELISEGVINDRIAMEFREAIQWATGTADGQINLAYYKRETGIGASVTTVYDLAGSLLDHSGNTISFAEVVLIIIRNRSSTAANYLLMGPDATNGFGVVASNKGFWADASDRDVVPADAGGDGTGGSFVIKHCKSGVAVSGGSTDELAVITQSGTSSNTWDIFIAGRAS